MDDEIPLQVFDWLSRFAVDMNEIPVDSRIAARGRLRRRVSARSIIVGVASALLVQQPRHPPGPQPAS
jgi:hypothetical protein